MQCAGAVCSVQVRCEAYCTQGFSLLVQLWHSSEDNLGAQTSRTCPGGGTMGRAWEVEKRCVVF